MLPASGDLVKIAEEGEHEHSAWDIAGSPERLTKFIKKFSFLLD